MLKGMNESTRMNQQNREASIITPEHVLLRFQTAGLGSRAAAQLIDTLILLLVNLTVFVVFSIVVFGRDEDFFLETENYAISIVILFLFVFNFGYFLLLEAFWGGQTLGKRWMGLRVIRDNGQPVTFLSAAIRNLFRIIDGLPMGYFLGAVVSFFHGQDKRIGDLVAGTIVVAESGQPSRNTRKRVAKQQSLAQSEWLSLPLEERQKQAISREDWQLLSAFVARIPSLSEDKKRELGQQIADRLCKKLEWNDEELVKRDPIGFLERLHGQLQNDWQIG